MSESPTLPRCDMTPDCAEPITHLDRKGYVYCTAHGAFRRISQPCRKLKPAELRLLAEGKQIARY